MTVIIKMKMILLHVDNDKNASKILFQLFIKILNNFFVFDKYKTNIIVLLTLDKSLGWTLIFNLNKIPLGETGCLRNPYFLLTGCLGIQFF